MFEEKGLLWEKGTHTERKWAYRGRNENSVYSI